jgi:hypothetical protein
MDNQNVRISLSSDLEAWGWGIHITDRVSKVFEWWGIFKDEWQCTQIAPVANWINGR